MRDACDGLLCLGDQIERESCGVDDWRAGDADLDGDVGGDDIGLGDGGEGSGAGEMIVGVGDVQEVALPEKLAKCGGRISAVERAGVIRIKLIVLGGDENDIVYAGK